MVHMLKSCQSIYRAEGHFTKINHDIKDENKFSFIIFQEIR